MSSSSSSSDLRNRIIFTIAILAVYRFGTFVPLPGIDPEQLKILMEGNQKGLLGMFNVFAGGAVSRMAIFALGIMPYISSSIIVQLLTGVSDYFKNLKSQGETGRAKITQITRYGTVLLATVQGYGLAVGLESSANLVINPGIFFKISTVTTIVAGTMFLMWLGEQITERGLGNGISLIIFAGIVAGLPSSLGGLFELVRTGSMLPIVALFIVALVIVVTSLVCFVERGQRRITVNYAKKQVGNKLYAGQSSHLPLKLNMAGVIPPIFASSIILFPATLASWFGSPSTASVEEESFSVATLLADFAASLSPGQPLYIALYACAIIFFCFFYTALVFNSKETADNLKRSGAFLPGIRPGDQTAKYIDKVLVRLTLIGAIYITGVCLLPEFLVFGYNIPFYFGGTSLLIIVVVTMDFMAQLQSYIMSQQYESLMKKSSFKTGGALR